jgi:hypothetical protein
MPLPTEPGIWGYRNGIWFDVSAECLTPNPGSIIPPWKECRITKFTMLSRFMAAQYA